MSPEGCQGFPAKRLSLASELMGVFAGGDGRGGWKVPQPGGPRGQFRNKEMQNSLSRSLIESLRGHWSPSTSLSSRALSTSLSLGPGWPSGRLPTPGKYSWKLLPFHQDRVWGLSSASGLLSMQSWRPPGRSLLPTVSCRPRVSNLRSPNKACNPMASLVNPVKRSKNECQTCSNCPYK